MFKYGTVLDEYDLSRTIIELVIQLFACKLLIHAGWQIWLRRVLLY